MPWSRTLWYDTESYCETPIRDGLYRYAEGVEIMLAAYAFNDGPVQVWDVTEGSPMPAELLAAFNDPTCEIVAQNSAFDRIVTRYFFGIDVPVERWFDTMVAALCHGLPGGLDILCDILKIPTDLRKHKVGKELVQLFCKPRPKNQKLRRATRFTHPVEWDRFKSYAGSDISSMRAVRTKLPKWNYPGIEMARWQLDQRINDRGFAVDVALAENAIRACDAAKDRLALRTQEITGDEVKRATQRDALLKHLLEWYGVDLPDMRADTLERRINDQNLPDPVRELLAIRLQASMASTAKYKALVKAVNSDGRLRGTLQFSGAQRTGRWAGRVFQPHNLPRLILEAIAEWFGIAIAAVKEHHVIQYLATGIEAMLAQCEDLLFVDVMALAANVVRGTLVAPTGRKLVVSDLSNIEGRMAAWLAGEEWKLQAFRDFDKGTGPDLYKLAYAKAFGISPEAVSKTQRQIGKVKELMLQYEGGVGAYLTGAATYGIDLAEMAATALPTIPGDVLQEAIEFYDYQLKKRRSTFGLTRDVFVACDSLKRLWRQSNPNIKGMWGKLAEASRNAILNPGVTFDAGRLRMRRDGAWLRMGLPSGRALCYPSPQLDGDKISYMGMCPYTKRWKRLHTYGGKLFENACQAGSAEVLKHNMPAIEAAGYSIVLTVHDETITEAPDHQGFSARHLSEILATQPEWAPGLPLAAGGFEAYRYRKE